MCGANGAIHLDKTKEKWKKLCNQLPQRKYVRHYELWIGQITFL